MSLRYFVSAPVKHGTIFDFCKVLATCLRPSDRYTRTYGNDDNYAKRYKAPKMSNVLACNL